ncbi:ribonuclease Z [Alteribacter natronophilus]|uniref:ribonuclease Z n=1 Tax=Alteribacter natronophilus TaxID=2583810 RepID=UPI00110DC12F|nr:ribonuclease Z [Alteribacter natronophilus]TMW73407.1 ribonuclease Z [Alteribacter natronophilus]
MKITFLGTGAGVPSKKRNVSSLVLHLENKQNDLWMFDCGESTQQQFLHTSLKPGKVKRIFISHLHGDHLYGLPGFLATRSFQGAKRPLTIYGPAGTEQFVKSALEISGTYLNYDCHFHEVGEGLIFNEDGMSVSAGKLDHGLPCFGFRIKEDDRPGALLMDKVEEAGISPGPWLKDLKERKTVTLYDGRTVHGEDFTGPPQPGKTVTILGDTRPCASAAALAYKADLLVHEATFASGEESRAQKYFHSTSAQAAETALKAEAGALLLNHISPRYTDAAPLVNEAVTIFPNTAAAEDFMTVKADRSIREKTFRN